MKKKGYLKQLRDKDLSELQTVLAEEREKLARLRLDSGRDKLKDYKEPGKSRKRIAQILTITQEKEIEKSE